MISQNYVVFVSTVHSTICKMSKEETLTTSHDSENESNTFLQTIRSNSTTYSSDDSGSRTEFSLSPSLDFASSVNSNSSPMPESSRDDDSDDFDDPSKQYDQRRLEQEEKKKQIIKPTIRPPIKRINADGITENLSSTNLYIRGLAPRTTDEDLVQLCSCYGKITSTKAILDKTNNQCKGYGFVDFENPEDAQKAVIALQEDGIPAQFAKQQEQDPTNLYFSNLPKNFEECDLEELLAPVGHVVSTRILRDPNGISRGVGFARLDSRERCEHAIKLLNNKKMHENTEPLVCKFADGAPNKKRNKDGLKYNDSSIQDLTSSKMQSRYLQAGFFASPGGFYMPAYHPSFAQYAFSGSSYMSPPAYIFQAPNNQMHGSSSDTMPYIAAQLNQLQMNSHAYSQGQNNQQYITHVGSPIGGWAVTQPTLVQDSDTESKHSRCSHDMVEDSGLQYAYYHNDSWAVKQ